MSSNPGDTYEIAREARQESREEAREEATSETDSNESNDSASGSSDSGSSSSSSSSTSSTTQSPQPSSTGATVDPGAGSSTPDPEPDPETGTPTPEELRDIEEEAREESISESQSDSGSNGNGSSSSSGSSSNSSPSPSPQPSDTGATVDPGAGSSTPDSEPEPDPGTPTPEELRDIEEQAREESQSQSGSESGASSDESTPDSGSDTQPSSSPDPEPGTPTPEELRDIEEQAREESQSQSGSSGPGGDQSSDYQNPREPDIRGGVEITAEDERTRVAAQEFEGRVLDELGLDSRGAVNVEIEEQNGEERFTWELTELGEERLEGQQADRFEERLTNQPADGYDPAADLPDQVGRETREQVERQTSRGEGQGLPGDELDLESEDVDYNPNDDTFEVTDSGREEIQSAETEQVATAIEVQTGQDVDPETDLERTDEGGVQVVDQETRAALAEETGAADDASERQARALAGLGIEETADGNLVLPDAPGSETLAEQRASARQTRAMAGLGIEETADGTLVMPDAPGSKTLVEQDIAADAADEYSDALGFEVPASAVDVTRQITDDGVRLNPSLDAEAAKEAGQSQGDVFSGVVAGVQGLTGINPPGQGSIRNVARVENYANEDSSLTNEIGLSLPDTSVKQEAALALNPVTAPAAIWLGAAGGNREDREERAETVRDTVIDPASDVASFAALAMSQRSGDRLAAQARGQVALQRHREGDGASAVEALGGGEGTTDTVAADLGTVRSQFAGGSVRGGLETFNAPALVNQGQTAVEVGAAGVESLQSGDADQFARLAGGQGTRLAAGATEAAVENPAATGGALAGAGAASLIPGAVAGRTLGMAGRGVRDRVRTAGGTEVPFGDLTTEPVEQFYRTGGDEGERFPSAEDPALYERDPAEAVREQAEQPDVVQEQFDTSSDEPILTKALGEEPEGPEGGRASQGFESAPAESLNEYEYESPGSFVGPDLSPNFLRVSGRAEFSPRPGIPRLGSQPTGVFLRTDVEEPSASDIQGFREELVDREGESTAYTKPPGEGTADEIEAIVPPGARFSDVGGGPIRNTLRRFGVGSDLYTTVGGRRVPLRSVVPESETSGSTGRRSDFGMDDRGQVEMPVASEQPAFTGRRLGELRRAGDRGVDRPVPVLRDSPSIARGSESLDGQDSTTYASSADESRTSARESDRISSPVTSGTVGSGLSEPVSRISESDSEVTRPPTGVSTWRNLSAGYGGTPTISTSISTRISETGVSEIDLPADLSDPFTPDVPDDPSSPGNPPPPPLSETPPPPPPKSETPPPPPRKWRDDDDDDLQKDNDEFRLLSDESKETEDSTATGWYSETVATIATQGSLLAGEAPDRETLENQPEELQRTGELPTAAYLEGDEETQEAIGETQDLLSGLRVDTDENSDNGGWF